MGRQANVDVQRFNLFGHSQGGQFVNRFLMLHAEHVHRAAACANGFYVNPASSEPVPWGVGMHPLCPEANFDFRKLVTSKLVLIVGTRDDDSRKEAAVTFAKGLREYATKNGLRSRVATRYVQRGEHSGEQNYPTASAYLFTDSIWEQENDF